MQHTINKLSFDFSCSREEQAFGVRKNFIKDNYAAIVSIINDECDHLSNINDFVEIDKLEVNIFLGEEVIYNPHKYLEALRKELRNQLESTKHSRVEKRSFKESRQHLLTYFLENGYLPWWAPVEGEVLLSICREINTSQQFGGLIDFLLKNKDREHIWERVVFQLSGDLKRSIISEIGVFREIKEKLKDSLEEQSLTGKFLQQSATDYEEQLTDFILKNGAQLFIKTGSNNSAGLPGEVRVLRDQFLLHIELASETTHKIPDDKQVQTHPQGFPVNIVHSNPEYQKGDQPHQKIRVSNSGIILLNVFLPSLFKNLEYWKNEQWISVESSTRAVHLLHYLATGRENPFEYELILEKVFCGIPVSQPVERWVRLTEREKQESDDLLMSMIDHWKSLKNTSVSGLRNSFFQREGLLSFKQDSCLLQIERKTMDILLETLPWGYATVRLPWNPYLIYTEW